MENTKSSSSGSGSDVSAGAGEIESIESEGKTPSEAIERALAILGVNRSKVKVKILSEEQKGLFGMEGARPAKVRVTLLKKKKA
jgi:spoIIIJ-associated protein